MVTTESSALGTGHDLVAFATAGPNRGALAAPARPRDVASAFEWCTAVAAHLLERTWVLNTPASPGVVAPGADGGPVRIGGLACRRAFDVGTSFAGDGAAARHREFHALTNSFPTDGVTAVSELGPPG